MQQWGNRIEDRYTKNTSAYFSGIKDAHIGTGAGHSCNNTGDSTYLIVPHAMPLDEML